MSIYAPQTAQARARRRRAGRTVTVVGLLALAGVVAPQAFASDGEAVSAPVDTHTVVAGETLWEIATDLTAQGHDVRDTVARIQRLNAMPTTSLDAGQQIYVPVAG
ncbi:LysM peptidoglycan-binding domain-containing protein [Demequina pelophila]|uniref:LysM peptidoglycan-binding domain-containing protein n=1 Tax=Demequina pelophila TaxID=1638984 RepID=UPI000782ECD2|nr:LysM peptidoglycan-binding domain-containing protein [Demequina pelophila]